MKELYEFGRFRVDAGKELLLRGGQPVPLTPKAFQILLVLLRRGQEVVTKDELLKAVWPDTFVEEGNLSRNVFLLRKALDESPQDRFIVTVPGRGYRLAEPVRRIDVEPEVAAPAAVTTVRAAEPGVVPDRPSGSGRRRFAGPRVLVAAVLLAAVAGAGLVVIRPARTPARSLSTTDTIVLADVSNATGDPVFDATLRQGVAVQLQQSPFLEIVSDQRIRQTLRLMQLPPDAPLTNNVAREACERAGAAAFVQGSISSLGSRYVLGLEARDCRTGGLIAAEQSQAARKEDVIGVLGSLIGPLRTRLGETLSSVEQHSTRLDEATTSSLDALRAYSAGWQALYSRGASAAAPFFQRAIEIDPGFAVAHASLGRAYADLDQSDLAAASLERAWQLREHTSEPERYFLTALYQVLVTGNYDAAQQTCEAWAHAYPRDVRPRALLAGPIHKTAGRYEAAVSEARLAIGTDPDLAIAYYALGVNSQYLGRLADAREAIRAAEARGLEIDEFLMLAYELDFLEGDTAQMEKDAARARARAGGENWMSAREAFVAAYGGRLNAARALSDRAVIQAVQADQRERAGLWQAGAAVREAWIGDAREAARRALAARELSHDRETTYGAALAFALTGDTTRAQPLLSELEARFPEDSSVAFNVLPVLRAQLALDRGDAKKAIELLQAAEQHELGVPRSTISALFGALYPVYVRGQAYLKLGRGADAVGEFTKITAHTSIVASDPVGVLAHLQLGRAYVLSGDRSRAAAAYRTFLDLWRDADADLPLLKKARAEAARLE